MYSDIVLGVPHEDFEELLETEKLIKWNDT